MIHFFKRELPIKRWIPRTDWEGVGYDPSERLKQRTKIVINLFFISHFIFTMSELTRKDLYNLKND